MKADIKYRCYRFVLAFAKFINKLSVEKRWEFLIDHGLRAATSVGANIVEAQSSTSRKEFKRYYEIALKSCNETKYWICLMRDDVMEIKDEILIQLVQLLNEATEISKILGKAVVSLKQAKQMN